MSTAQPTNPPRPPPSVFLSYASEDRKAAQSVRDALQTYGLEVWYDESGLDGGDAWDQKIRRQIRECNFFMPLISAQTDARPEGYFRREWRLAVERTHDMADDHAFLLPIVVDETTQARARVPERFLTVQWTRVPGGQATAALEALCRRLLSGPGPAADSTPRAP
ncbi:MAG TPA: toll/interleukin-1 receptor domain-containing protein, partial [Steroidobacteraceae bacterium]|nr:toll/interleukin-1 receptor domain-containing protein [Steroidobacteraceae bacterium]